MAVRDILPGKRDPTSPDTELRDSERVKPKPYIQDRMKRGRDRMLEGAPKRNECLKFWRGDQYCYVNDSNELVKFTPGGTYVASGTKPRHRVRTVRNLILDAVAHEVSAATQRVPGYEISPTSSDPDRQGAAVLAKKVALYGYDKWKVRKAMVKLVTYAVVADEGFAWPVFDNTIGPFIDDGEGGLIGQGDIRIRVFGPNEVYWEPGQDFDDSKWHVVEQARPLEDVYAMDGYLGGKLKPDADTSDVKDGKAAKNMVLVSEYLERPTAKNPVGMWLVVANDREIVLPRKYPCVNGKDEVLDEPVLHALAYFVDPDSDRNMGLVRHGLDAQRTINDCTNKQLEWKNLALMPQWLALKGMFGKRFRRTDEPGAVWEVNSLEGFKQLDVPNVPPDLQNIKDEARADMGRIFAQNDLPTQVESGKGIATLDEKDMSRRQDFFGNVADVYSRLTRHCLYLVQRHFTEPRLAQIEGPFGPDPFTFVGADLLNEDDVRVLPGSIEPLTQDGIMQRLQLLSTMFPGQISLEKAMAALNGASLDGLDQGYHLQVEKQQREIKQMLALGDTLGEFVKPEDYDKAGIPIPAMWDDDVVHLDVLHQFMQTEIFDRQPVPVKKAFELHEQAHRQQQNAKMMLQQQAQDTMAQAQGAANAAKPQQPAAPPDVPQAP